MLFARSCISLQRSAAVGTICRSAQSDSFLVSSRCNSTYEVVIAGGGTAGISVGSRLCNSLGSGKVAIIEPSEVCMHADLLLH